MWKLAVVLTIYVSICIVYRILPSFAFQRIVVQKMWMFAVTLATYTFHSVLFGVFSIPLLLTASMPVSAIPVTRHAFNTIL
jgi:hypothetical protein